MPLVKSSVVLSSPLCPCTPVTIVVVMVAETDTESIWVACLWNSIRLKPQPACSPWLILQRDGSWPACGSRCTAGHPAELCWPPASPRSDPSTPPCHLSWLLMFKRPAGAATTGRFKAASCDGGGEADLGLCCHACGIKSPCAQQHNLNK